MNTPARPSWPERLLPLLCAALGLLWYVFAGGGPTLNPTNFDWLGGGDLGQHVMGWLMFRNEGWRLPLGAVPSLLYPIGGSVAYTDANPWVALLLKPFSSVLPTDFQYIGPWLGSCFALQGVFGFKVMETLTPHRAQRVLGAALFIMAPPLLHRMGHDTLCAQWMLLALVWLHLRPVPDAATARRLVGWAVGINLLAAGIHPYLAAMVFLLTLGLLARLHWVERRLSRGALLGVPAALGAAVVGLFWLFGYIGQRVTLGGEGLGHFSADLLAFFNSHGLSRWVPGLPAGPGQYEGFGYLGAGMLALGAVALVSWRVRTPREPLSWRPLVALLAVGACFFLFALSPKMTAAGHTFLSMRTLAAPLEPLLAPLRSSGRFIWLPHYLLVAGALALTVRVWRSRPAVATGLMLAAVALQAVETPGTWDGSRFGHAPWPRLRAPQWAHVTAPYRHLALYPPFDGSLECRQGVTYDFTHYLAFADLAYRQRLTLNSGSFARVDMGRVEGLCRGLNADVKAGRFARDTVYVVHPQGWADFTRPGSGMVCGTLEEQRLCVSADVASPLRDLLAGAPAVADGTGG